MKVTWCKPLLKLGSCRSACSEFCPVRSGNTPELKILFLLWMMVQCLRMVSVKKFSITPNWNFSCSHLCLFPLVASPNNFMDSLASSYLLLPIQHTEAAV